MGKVSVKPFRPVYPSPAALITSASSDGKANIITLGEVYNLSVSKPVIVGISIAKPRYSHKLISESLEFVLNLPTTRILEKVDRCGTMSGREVDKFSKVGLTPIPASKVNPPLIAECPVNLECGVMGIEEIGDHDMFTGEVIVEHVDEDLLDEHGRIQVEKLDAVCYMLGEYWSLGQKLGNHGFSRQLKK
ncbi:MAG: flavin reductase family protein [Candidatus Poribacteria bacterium]